MRFPSLIRNIPALLSLLLGGIFTVSAPAPAQQAQGSELDASTLALTPFIPAQATDPANTVCARLAAGSSVASAPELFSANGTLEVTFHFRTAVDAQGLTRYCYVTGTGLESPNLFVNPGDHLVLHFENDIPTAASTAVKAQQMPGMVMPLAASAPASDCNAQTMNATSTNLHFHGLNASPACHQDEVVHTTIQPGQTFDYDVLIPSNEPAGLYWYHPHPHGFSESQVIGGASGALVVQGIQNFNTAVAGLPSRILVIRDQKLTAAETRASGPVKPATDLSLNYIPVTYPNYVPAVIQTPAGEKEFWRIANTSADTLVDLQYLVNGTAQQIQLIAVDGVPLTDGSGNPHISTRTDALLPPGARAEFILTTPPAGAKAQLVTETWNNGNGFDIDPGRPLANIVSSTAASVQTASAISARLPEVTQSLPVSRFAALSEATPTASRSLYFSVKSDFSQFYLTIDGQTPAPFSMDAPPNIVVRSGAVEQWTVENRSPMDHAFHIHQIHFQLLAINGSPVSDTTLRDTINVPHWNGAGAYPSVTLLLDFRDPGIVGTFVYHCHVLSHEDRGMMGSIQVLPPLAETTTSLSASSSTINAGASDTFTAKVGGTSGTPTGTVTFLNGSTALGTASLNSSGIAIFTTSALPAGSDSITASYGGDTNNAASTSSSVTVTVASATAPRIISLSRNYGAPGAVLTVSGTNFGATQGTSVVAFNGTAATPSSWTGTAIVVSVPNGASSGNITVRAGAQTSNGLAYTVYPLAVITGISPTSGSAGTIVTITGTNLQDGGTHGGVTFNGTTAAPSSVSSTVIKVAVPGGSGTGRVNVVANGRTVSGPVFTVSSGSQISAFSQ